MRYYKYIIDEILQVHNRWDITSKAYFNSVFNYHFIRNSTEYSTAYGNYLQAEIV